MPLTKTLTSASNEPITEGLPELPEDYRFSAAYLAFCHRAISHYLPHIEAQYKVCEVAEHRELFKHLYHMGLCTEKMITSAMRNGIRT